MPTKYRLCARSYLRSPLCRDGIVVITFTKSRKIPRPIFECFTCVYSVLARQANATATASTANSNLGSSETTRAAAATNAHEYTDVNADMCYTLASPGHDFVRQHTGVLLLGREARPPTCDTQ